MPHNCTALHSFLYPMPTLVIADFLTSWSVTRRCKGGRLFRNIEVLHTDKSGLYDPETRSNWWMKDSDKAGRSSDLRRMDDNDTRQMAMWSSRLKMWSNYM